MTPTAEITDEQLFEGIADRLMPYIKARIAADDITTEQVTVRPPDGPYVLLDHAKYALRNGPLTLDAWVAAVRAQGFEHRRPPKRGRKQLPQSLRSLVSPSQHADVFTAVSRAGEPTRYKLR